MVTIDLVLLVLALVCFLLAAFKKPVSPYLDLVATGLAFWMLSVIV